MRRRREGGFTLLEVMVAISLMGIMLSGLPAAFISFSQYNSRMELRTQALAAAQQVLDDVRMDDPQSLPSSGSTSESKVVDGRTFDVIVNFCDNPTWCDTNSRHLSLEVDYNGQLSIVEVETVYTKLR